MAEVHFSLTFSGPALEAGEIDVAALAPSLLALSALIKEAQRIADPEAGEVALRMRATHRGSFEVSLSLAHVGVLDQLVGLFSNKDAGALANLLELVVGTTSASADLLAFIKWLKKRVIHSAEKEHGSTVVVTEDGDSVEIPTPVYKFYENPEVRRSLREVVAPLDDDGGIDRMTFTRGDGRQLEIGNDEAGYFELPVKKADIEIDTTFEVLLQLVAPVFKTGNKWRFSGIAGEIYASMEDPDFLARVGDNTELFGANDMFRCRLRLIQTRENGRVVSQYSILEVLNHERANRMVTPPLE